MNRPKRRRSDGPSQSNTEFWENGYQLCYMVGMRTMRILKSLIRFTRTLWRPIAHGLKTLAEVLLLRHLRNRQRRKVLITVFNVVAPVAAAVVLLVTLLFWRQAEFALELTYGDTTIGYIADEAVYSKAATLVKDSVIDPQSTFTMERTPEMALSVVSNETLLTEEEIRDRILTVVSGEVVEAAGLYVNGTFYGALATRQAVVAEMTRVLSAHESEDFDGVDFFDAITIVEGTYPADAIISEAKMTNYLKNLPIKTVKNISYTETVEYSTIIVQDATQPLGYETVVTKGKDGKQKVYAQIIYVNGEEKYQTVVSTEAIKEVVNKVVKVGAQTYSDESVLGDGVATGKFVWPLPYTKTISSPFASRWGKFHGAIDIANGSTFGKPIIASDGGTVVEAEFHSSYGYYVLIDHGNGFKTRYAHCSKLEVEEGDKVAQGQYIAKVGNTGYSFGAHLHFEVIKDGVLVNPLDYVQR